jgi:hypothetical protein
MTTKKIIIILLIGVIGISFTGCLYNISSKPCNNKTVTKGERTLNKFSEINLAVAADIHLTQGSPQKVEIEGPACDLENIKTIVSGSSLSIHNEHNIYGNREKTTIYITVEDINSLSIAGSGSIIAKTAIRSNDLDLDITGSGSIIIQELNAVTVKSSIAGSGSIELSGTEKTEKHKIQINGSGDIKAKNLPTSIVDVSIAGSGTCYLNVIEKLKASIMGSGDIYYSGKPEIESSSAGSGKIKPLQ